MSNQASSAMTDTPKTVACEACVANGYLNAAEIKETEAIHYNCMILCDECYYETIEWENALQFDAMGGW